MLNINFEKIEDPVLRDVLREFASKIEETFIKGKYQIIEFNFNSAVTNKKVRHNLGFKPTDVITLNESGTGTITYFYEKFDRDFIVFSTTGDLTRKVLVGRSE